MAQKQPKDGATSGIAEPMAQPRKAAAHSEQQASAALQPPAAGADAERWRLSSLLVGAGATAVLAEAMVGKACQDELAATHRLAVSGKAALVATLENKSVLAALVDQVWPTIEALANPDQAATAEELHNKFVV